MKGVLIFCFLLSTTILKAQHDSHPTENVLIEGKIKATNGFSLNDLKGYKTIAVDSLVIYNHLMEKKRTLKNIKGVLLKELLAKVEFDVTSPKLLSEFYITCIAADGYKVVFSWNEIFNSDEGNHLMIVTEENGLTGTEMKDRIAILCPTDIATGRRYVQGLEKIIVERVK